MSDIAPIAERLGETEPQALGLIARIVRRLGYVEAERLVDAAVAREAAGGMLTSDGTRRRTVGGIFFVLVREHLETTGQEELAKVLFPPRRRVRRPKAAAPAAQPPVAATLRPRRAGTTALPPPRLPRLALPATPSASVGPPDPNVIVAVLDRTFAGAEDIYRRKINPQTGAVTLSAHFPGPARARYAEQIAAASQAIGAPVTISDEPHQQMLAAAAREALPAGLEVAKISIHAGRSAVALRVSGDASEEDLAGAAERFRERTGWALEVVRG